MKNLALFAILTLSCVVAPDLHGQPLRPGEWRTYTSMRSVRDVAMTLNGRYIWAATSGGAFRVDVSDPGSYLELRNTDGLTANELSAVAVDASGNVYLGG